MGEWLPAVGVGCLQHSFRNIVFISRKSSRKRYCSGIFREGREVGGGGGGPIMESTQYDDISVK